MTNLNFRFIPEKSYKKKCLLIYPGTLKIQVKRLPLSLLYLAESLLSIHHYEPIILDLQVDRFHPVFLKDVVCVGISTLTGKQIMYALKIAEKIKEINPNIPIIWGGIHPILTCQQTIKHPLVDYVVFGEGEETIKHLVQALDNGNKVDKILGVAHKQGEKVIINPPRPFINFNKYNNLPYDLLSISKYPTSNRFEYQSSRGCPYGCLFYYNKQFNFFRWRFKDSKIVIDELEKIKKIFNPTYLFLVDDEFFINKKRAFDIIKGLIERNIIFKWKPAVRIDMINTFTEEEFTLLEKSGCFELALGAESGSNRILKLIRKRITNKDIYESAKKSLHTKITPQYSFMSGFPTETKDELDETLNCIDQLWKINKKIKVNGLFLATPFPGTDLFNIVSKMKEYKVPDSLEEWGQIDLVYPKQSFAYIPDDLYKNFKIYNVIVQFIFLWMQSTSFLKVFKNINSLKYYKFFLFKILFFGFYLIFKFRWKKKFIKFPIDIVIMRNTLSKISS